jgi:hypothetical protein
LFADSCYSVGHKSSRSGSFLSLQLCTPFFQFRTVHYSNDQAEPGRKELPEEQSVCARDGAADPQGCGNPLRSGSPFLTLHQHPIAIVFPVIHKSTGLFAKTQLFHHLALSPTSLYCL